VSEFNYDNAYLLQRRTRTPYNVRVYTYNLKHSVGSKHTHTHIQGTITKKYYREKLRSSITWFVHAEVQPSGYVLVRTTYLDAVFAFVIAESLG
jgi:hypothetical protein